MNLQHINVKIFVDGDLAVGWDKFIEVFHGWTASQSMPEMMIDVADYRHVPHGPGVVLVGHEADYFMDNTDGRPGLRYSCKIEQDGSNEDRIRHAFEAAAAACARLEAALPGLQFCRTGIELSVNDRAIAPNTAETRAVAGMVLPGLLENVFGKGVEFSLQTDDRKLFGATIAMSEPFNWPPK